MTALPPWMRRFLIGIAWLALALGLVAALLSASASATAEFMPILRAAMGAVGLGIGYLIGQVLRPLARWQPPVPVSAESAAPAGDRLGRVWLRGFAAGFWILIALWIALALLANLLVPLLALGPAIPILIYAVGVALLLPTTMARAMVAGGEGLPPWTLVAAAGAGFIAGLGLYLTLSLLITGMAAVGFAVVSDVAALLALLVIPAIAVGTPALARDLWPSRRGPAWTGLLALVAMAGAGLLLACAGAWTGLLGPAASWLWLLPGAILGASWLWLLPGSVLWGGSLGALLVVAIARGRADRSPGAGSRPRRVHPLLLAAGALGLVPLGLLPLALWLATIAAPNVFRASSPPGMPPGASSGFPGVTQPATLSIAGPPLQAPPAGVTLTGPVWRFSWRPPPGASPRDLYQFVLWSPGTTRPLTQVILPAPVMRIAAAGATRRSSPSGPWIWRVRVIRPGQGAGQWSEARPFTPR